jgi:outer membrane protein assembly factor BamA
MVPLGDRRFVIGLHGWTVFSDVKDGHAVPFYMLPVLGGNNTIRAYDDYQFHDQNTVLATAELRIAVLAHLDAAVFYDAGNVAGRWRDLNFDKTAIGGGLRLHLRRATFARMDIAHGAQGWTAIFRTSEPLKLSRVTRRLASVPFMP